MNEESKKTLREMKQELFNAWKYLFVLQLIIGGHAIYELAAEYPDMGLFEYAFVLVFGAAAIAAILLTIVVVLFCVAAGIFVGVQVWKEKRNG